jgi:DNA-binding LacI/PurR family transcriptional regulator
MTGRRSKPMVDIRRVASEASVSIATVSRVVSGRGPVNDDTAQRVQRVVDRLGYHPSASARSLRTSQTMMMGVLVPDLSNPVFIPFLRGVQQVAQAEGYSVMVIDAQRSADVERRALDRLVEQRVDALVLAGAARDPSLIEALRASGVAVADGQDPTQPSRSLIPALERPGSVALCVALADLGHRRVGFVSRDEAMGDAGRRRWSLIRRTGQRLGLRTVRLSVGSGASAKDVARLLRAAVFADDPITALICSAHGLAPTLLGGMGAGRIAIPHRCSFVTYGDSDWALAYRPTISVVSMDLFGVAELMTSRLIAQIRGEHPSVLEPQPARFIRRESVGAAPG